MLLVDIMRIENRLKSKSDKNTSRWLMYAVLFTYVAINAVLVYFHEPWRDEAQSYLLCRDLNLGQLLAQMHVEGHSCLWLLLCFPWIKLGAPIFVQNVISLAICSFAAWIVLFKSPLPVYTNVAIVFSQALFYFFAVIARCYALIPLALFLNVWAFPNRKKRPYMYALTIALLIQTHLFMIVMAFLLSVWFAAEQLCDGIREGRLIRKLCPLLCPLTSALLFLAQLLPTTGKISKTNEDYSVFTSLIVFGGKLFGTFSNTGLVVILILSFAMLGVIVIAMLNAKAETRIACAIMVVSSLALNVISVYVYPMLTDQKIAICLVVISWGMMIIAYDRQLAKSRRSFVLTTGFTVLLVAIGFHGMVLASSDVSCKYSYAEDAARWINMNVPAGTEIWTNEPEASSILPYCDNYKQFKCSGESFSYVDWNKSDNLLPLEKDDISLPQNGYFITSSPDTEEYLKDKGYEEVYRSPDDSLISEGFAIFRIEDLK